MGGMAGAMGAAPQANKSADTFFSSYTPPQANSSGMGAGESSGLGQGGYGTAPAFGQQVNGIANNNANTAVGGMAPAFGQPNSGGFYRNGEYIPPIQSVNSDVMQPPANSPYLQQWNQQQGMGLGGGFGQRPQPFNFGQQQAMRQQQQNPYFSQMRQGYNPQQQGLQQLLGNMLSRYQQPQQRAPMQMPQYQNQALQYRPDISGAQQNLSRVAKSVVLQQKEAAEAELAAMKEAEAARLAQQQTQDYGGGG